MADEQALFPLGGEGLVPAVPAPPLSATRRRTVRQAAAIAHGRHPIGLALRVTLRLHRDIARRCGNCRWRQTLNGGTVRAYPKCAAGDGARATRSAATDVRAWWPGCTDHEYGDPAVGPDAARWVPPADGT